MDLERLPSIRAASENLTLELEKALAGANLNQSEIEQQLSYFLSGYWNRLESRVVAAGIASRARVFPERKKETQAAKPMPQE
jgi:hypothetical protein